tara:strand:+ start:1119 stop:1820 length:702 start_codon:yes stop_codon:yes gene_type:complete
MTGFRVEDLSGYLPSESDAKLIYWNKKNNGSFNYLLSTAKKMNVENNLAYSSQIHSNSIAVIESPGMVGEYDSLVTKKYGIIIAIQVADCVPIYITHKESGVIGLIHAGWRGSNLGITKDTINLIEKDFHVSPTDITIFVGPSIRSCCYEIGKEVAEKFTEENIILRGKNNYYLDLININVEQLIIAGIQNHNIRIDKRCTMCSNNFLHSFRRDGKKAGRNVCLFAHKGIIRK